jgi:hypothetical protein
MIVNAQEEKWRVKGASPSNSNTCTARENNGFGPHSTTPSGADDTQFSMERQKFTSFA